LRLETIVLPVQKLDLALPLGRFFLSAFITFADAVDGNKAVVNSRDARLQCSNLSTQRQRHYGRIFEPTFPTADCDDALALKNSLPVSLPATPTSTPKVATTPKSTPSPPAAPSTSGGNLVPMIVPAGNSTATGAFGNNVNTNADAAGEIAHVLHLNVHKDVKIIHIAFTITNGISLMLPLANT
jgi:hypothetical protein